MRLSCDFAWDQQAGLVVQSPPEYDVMASMIEGDLGGRRSRVATLRDFVVQARTGGSREQELRTGEGFYVRVRGEDVVIESTLELYPDTTYRTQDLLDVLAGLDQWLRDNPRQVARPDAIPDR